MPKVTIMRPLDYSFPEVRQRYRAAIVEVANEYDVDGIELDFTRSPYFFQPSEAWDKRAILTRFVRDIRDTLNRIGAKRNRPLPLVLRVACTERALTIAGIDLRQWIKERLAPILVISELANNFNQSIEPWLSLCREAGVQLYPAVEAGSAANAAHDFYSPLVRNPLAPRHDGAVPVASMDESLGLQRAAAQNFLAQKPAGIAMFNYACKLAEGKNIMHADPAAFHQATSVLREMGSLKTLARQHKHYTFFKALPIYVEASRPRRFHQTIPFAIRGKDIREGQATVRFHWIAEKNPHAGGKFRQNPFVKLGVIKVYLNDREIPEQELKKTKVAAGRLPSGFLLKAHQLVELKVPGRAMRDGENTLAFEMPKFPDERDPYVYIYDLAVDVDFMNSTSGTNTSCRV